MKENKKLFLFISLAFIMPLVSFAHGTIYLEYNPDDSNFIKDSNVATPSQVFFAQSDFMSGFDLWLANPGSAGTAKFDLLNEQGTILTSKTVTIPTIALTSSGTRFHVDWSFQLPVLSDDKYTIKITSSMPELRIYYSDRVQLVSHNAPFVSEYITGVAQLGSEEQIYSFKYALYEVTETSAPIISNVGWTVISPTQMKVEFNANEAVDYRIEYGLSGQGYTQSTNFSGGYEFCTYGILNCSIAISVSPNSIYDYRLTAKDTWGNQSQSVGGFTSGQAQTPTPTPSQIDEPPIISNLRIVDVTNNSVGVAWTTNEIANSRLLIVLSGFISVTAESDSTFELEHFLETEGVLSPGTDYLAEVTSFDIANNKSIASISFVTLSSQPSPSPTPTTTPTPTSSPPPPTTSPTSSLTPSASATPTPTENINTSPINDGQTTVEWAAPEDGEPEDGYRVDIFDQEGNLKETIYVASGEHKINIGDLNDEEEYTVIVYQNDQGVFKKLDQPVKTKVQEESAVKRLLKFWYLLVIVAGLIGYLVWKHLQSKASQVPQTPVS